MNNDQTARPNGAQIAQAIISIANGLIDAIRSAGPAGIAAGLLFMPLVAHGCTLQQFEAITSALVESGRVMRGANSVLIFVQ